MLRILKTFSLLLFLVPVVAVKAFSAQDVCFLNAVGVGMAVEGVAQSSAKLDDHSQEPDVSSLGIKRWPDQSHGRRILQDTRGWLTVQYHERKVLSAGGGRIKTCPPPPPEGFLARGENGRSINDLICIMLRQGRWDNVQELISRFNLGSFREVYPFLRCNTSNGLAEGWTPLRRSTIYYLSQANRNTTRKMVEAFQNDPDSRKLLTCMLTESTTAPSSLIPPIEEIRKMESSPERNEVYNLFRQHVENNPLTLQEHSDCLSSSGIFYVETDDVQWAWPPWLGKGGRYFSHCEGQ